MVQSLQFGGSNYRWSVGSHPNLQSLSCCTGDTYHRCFKDHHFNNSTERYTYGTTRINPIPTKSSIDNEYNLSRWSAARYYTRGQPPKRTRLREAVHWFHRRERKVGRLFQVPKRQRKEAREETRKATPVLFIPKLLSQALDLFHRFLHFASKSYSLRYNHSQCTGRHGRRI